MRGKWLNQGAPLLMVCTRYRTFLRAMLTLPRECWAAAFKTWTNWTPASKTPLSTGNIQRDWQTLYCDECKRKSTVFLSLTGRISDWATSHPWWVEFESDQIAVARLAKGARFESWQVSLSLLPFGNTSRFKISYFQTFNASHLIKTSSQHRWRCDHLEHAKTHAPKHKHAHTCNTHTHTHTHTHTSRSRTLRMHHDRSKLVTGVFKDIFTLAPE